MKFNIYKTSTYEANPKTPPHKNAVFIERTRSERRKHKENYFEIEINTLDELIEIVKNSEPKEIVLLLDDTSDRWGNNEMSIEIYDTYRE